MAARKHFIEKLWLGNLIINFVFRFCKSSSSSISTDIPDYTTANVKQVAKDIQKKTANIVDQLKYLRTAFSYTSDFVSAFLEVGNSLHALVGYLTGKNSALQLEASWCITNLSANYDNDNIMQVVKATAPYLIAYLQSGSELIQDQSALALGNMAADSDEVRELLFQQGILYPLMELSKVNKVLLEIMWFQDGSYPLMPVGNRKFTATELKPRTTYVSLIHFGHLETT